MKKNKLNLILLIFGIILLSGCYPEGPDDVDDLETVLTQFDQDFNFEQTEYYLMPDTVALISADPDYEKTEEELQQEESMLNAIAQQMNAAGYTRIALADMADDEKMSKALVLLATKSITTYTDYYYDYYYYGYDYWNWYGGINYYYPGYRFNYYYPWGYPVSYSYTFGTVILELVDPNEPVEINNDGNTVDYPVRWMAILNGLLDESVIDEQKVNNKIEQAFDQSPYLY